jgi:L-ascorbate metabolism protein UlaG (beta-lactamase superfamily)
MDIEITFIGTATVLIRFGGITVLTDPNFLHQGQHAYLGYGLVSRRLRAPALQVEELPPLDAVVLSHMHGDHWDRVAERGLRRDVPIITTHAAARRLRQKGFREAQGLDTWDTWSLDKDGVAVTLTALPGRHAPLAVRRLLPPVMGTMLEFGEKPTTRRLYLSGDTLLIEELAEIPARFDAIDAGVLHLGGTRLPAGARLPVGLTVTMDGRQGAEAAALLDLPTVIPVHFDDYGVFASPLSDFVDEMDRRGLADRVVLLERGVTKAI